MSEPFSPNSRPLVVGANHRSSSMMLRDRLFVEDAAMPDFLERLRQAGIEQALVLSTCDRVEVLAFHNGRDDADRLIGEALAGHAEMTPADLKDQTYTLWDADAVRHIFSVTASLDSLMIGEPQVLGQVKASHRMSQDAAMSGAELEALMQAAYASAKHVRSETTIGQRPVSVAAAATQLAYDLHGDLGRCTGLLIGAGDMGELVASSLLQAGLGHLTVTHPAEARAEAMARLLDCNVAPFDELTSMLAEMDIVLAALGKRRNVLSAEMVAAGLMKRRHKPVFLVDAAIPSDIDPAVNNLEDAFLYDLGDLERVAMDGRSTRESEASEAWKIIAGEVASFLRGRAERAAVPALNALRRHFEAEREKALADAGNDAEKATRLLISRLLHGPSEVMRETAVKDKSGEAGGADDIVAGDWEAAERILRRLFPLDEAPDGNGGED